MAKVEGAIVGAGTIVSAGDVARARIAGATFIVTPGLSAATVAASRDAGIPILPGIATATELMAGLDLGVTRFKFFPAEQAGGRPMLDAFRGPFGTVKFCPTGGISLDLARDYLKRPNVACVGGGWVCPTKLIDAGKWDEIGALAREAAALPRG
jgi:2-dehydro-3-deoxyphosphogluconate aldolase/(4S)-4-hydroxy-2-oxoglutarate aldolase